MKANRALGVVAGLLVLAGFGAAAVRQQSIAALRTGNEALATRQAEAETLRAKHAQIDRLRNENAEVQRLKAANRDLPRLRNEIRAVREESKQLAVLRAENQRLRTKAGSATTGGAAPAADARPVITLDQVQFAGYATPEATLQTLLWGMKHGDLNAVLRCVSPEAAKEIAGESPEGFQKQREEMAKQFKGARIAAKKMVSSDEVHLGIQMHVDGKDEPQEMALPFKRVGGEWKLSHP